MKRNKEEVLFCAFSAYLTLSLLTTALLFLGSLAGMKTVFAGARLALGLENVYRFKPLICDACGFAFASAGTAASQYYMLSLLNLSGAGRRALAALLLFTSVFIGLFFWRIAANSSFGAYGLSGITITICALLGGLQGLFQRPRENPWPLSASSCFQ